MARRCLELAAALALIGAGVAGVLLLPSGHPGRIAAGIVLVLAPGAAVAAALLPGRIGGPERLAAVLAGAVMVAIGATLALNATPWSLDTTHWAVVLGGVGAIAAAAAVVGRRGAPLLPWVRRLPRVRDVVVMALAAVVLAGALIVGLTPAQTPAGTPGQTALWAVPSDHDPRQVRVGVTGGDFERTAYRVVVTLDGHALGAPRQWTIDPARTRSELVTAPQDAGTRLEATLYRASDPSEAVRSVFVTLPAT